MEDDPRVKFCEVIMVEDNEKELNEDNYRGIYILVEKIKRDEERVDITKTLENKNETSFILAKDRQKEQDYSITSYGKEIDQSKILYAEELAGRGIIAKVEGKEILIGNDKLMKEKNILDRL